MGICDLTWPRNKNAVMSVLLRLTSLAVKRSENIADESGAKDQGQGLALRALLQAFFSLALLATHMRL